MAENKKQNQEVVQSEIVPAGKMEFRLINPTEKGFIQTIKWNKEELEAAVRGKIASYQNVVYTEDNIKQAKADRAELNKLKKAIDERRKKVKELVTQPYDTFKGEVDSVLELIDEPITLIDKQIKEFENRQKEQKKEKLKKTYEETIGDLAEVLPFEKVFDTRYLNQTFKLATAQAEIKEKIERVRTDLETIDSLESKYKLNAKDVYIKTLDLSKALAENKRLSDLEEKLEAEKRRKAEEEAERKRQAEERRRAEAEKLKDEQAVQNQSLSEEVQGGTKQPESGTVEGENVSEPTENGTITQENESGPVSPMGKVIESIERQAYNTAVDPFRTQPTVGEKKYKTRFWAVGTMDELTDLTDYMKAHNIKFGKVE